MRYCEFKSYMHGAPPANWDKEYVSPMYGDNGLYNKVPMDNTPVYLLMPKTGDEERYGDLEQCVDAILTALEIDGLPMVSLGAAYSSPDLDAVIDDPDTFFRLCASMCGYNGKYNLYTPGWRYYSPTETSDYGVGNIDLQSGYKACWAFMQVGGEHPLGGINTAFMQSISGTDRFVYIFDVFPYDVFRNAKFDFSVMKDAVSHPSDIDWKRYATVRVEIWEEEDGDLVVYNCNAQISGIDMNILTLNDYYQGEGTNVYEKGNKIKDPGEKDDTAGGGNRKNEDVTIPELPGADMTSAGGLRIYSLNPADIKSLFDYLHSHDPGESLVKWWQNPIQGLLSLHYLPYAIKYKGNAPTYESINVLGLSTGVSALVCDQWQEINFGYLDLDYESGSYLDMSPYTKVSIYLPGIGIREINTDDVMGRRIWVKYQCDNVTGQFVAYVAVGTKNTPENQVSIRYAFSGQVAASFPLSQENWGNTYISGATLVAGALALGVAGAGAAGAAAGSEGGAGAFMSSEANTTALKGAASGVGKGAISKAGSAASLLAKPTISRSGAVSGTTSLFAYKKPYLIIESPSYYAYDGAYAGVKGWRYGTYQPFSKLKGYAEIEACHLHDITATLSELNEIEALLNEGVMF